MYFHLPGSISVSRRVLQKCHFKLRNELDVPLLLPYLNQYHLISPDVHEQLTLPATHGTKVDKLLAELPRRERFLQRFIECLRESAEREPGTSHGRIADALEEELKLQNTSGSYTIDIVIAKSLFNTQMQRAHCPMLICPHHRKSVALFLGHSHRQHLIASSMGGDGRRKTGIITVGHCPLCVYLTSSDMTTFPRPSPAVLEAIKFWWWEWPGTRVVNAT